MRKKKAASSIISLTLISRLLSRDLGILCLVTFLGFVIYANLDALLPALASILGISDAQIGLPFSLNAIMVLLLQMLIAIYIDKAPKKMSMLIGLALITTGFFSLAFAKSFLDLAISIVIITLGELFFHLATAAFVAAIAPTEGKGRYFGLYGTFLSLGMSTGPLISGRIWDLFGKEGPWYLSLFVGLLALGICSLLREGRRRREECFKMEENVSEPPYI